MLRLSSVDLISNIANVTRFVITQESGIACGRSFMQAKRGQAYFSKSNHIKACEHHQASDLSLTINNQKNGWQLPIKLNSGEDRRVIAIPK